MTSPAQVTSPPLCCPRCKAALEIQATIECPTCHLQVRTIEHGIAYDYATLLKAMAPDRYQLYRTLCNNGFISYHELAEGSLSLASRKDVAEFGAFLDHRISKNALVLDVGCGSLPLPGYLIPLKEKRAELLGLEIYPTSFEGFRIQGCAEFIPLRDHQLDAVVFATSLDHVFDLEATLRETRRVLRPGGCCCIWMSDRQPYWHEFVFAYGGGLHAIRQVLIAAPKQVVANVRLGQRPFYAILHLFKHGRYWEYPNGSVFYCPPGAIDPFHSWFERPSEVAELAARNEFTVAEPIRASSGFFLSLTA